MHLEKDKPRREPRFPLDTRIIVNRAGPSVSGQAIDRLRAGCRGAVSIGSFEVSR